MQQPCLDLAPHEAVFKGVIDDVTSGGLDSQNSNIDVFISAGTFGGRLCDTKQVAARWGGSVLAI